MRIENVWQMESYRFWHQKQLQKNENVQEQQILRKKVTPVIFVEEEDEVGEPKNELSPSRSQSC